MAGWREMKISVHTGNVLRIRDIWHRGRVAKKTQIEYISSIYSSGRTEDNPVLSSPRGSRGRAGGGVTRMVGKALRGGGILRLLLQF